MKGGFEGLQARMSPRCKGMTRLPTPSSEKKEVGHDGVRRITMVSTARKQAGIACVAFLFYIICV